MFSIYPLYGLSLSMPKLIFLHYHYAINTNKLTKGCSRVRAAQKIPKKSMSKILNLNYLSMWPVGMSI